LPVGRPGGGPGVDIVFGELTGLSILGSVNEDVASLGNEIQVGFGIGALVVAVGYGVGDNSPRQEILGLE